MRENCLAEFDKHWNCLEMNNQVGLMNNMIFALPVSFARRMITKNILLLYEVYAKELLFISTYLTLATFASFS